MNSTVALVIPCYNEARRLDLAAYKAFLESAPWVNLVFVDDGSTDDTASIVRRFASTFDDGRASVLALEKNAGKAEAVRRGLLHALGTRVELVGFWDADFATPLDAIFDFLGVMSRRPDIDWIIGARVQLLGRDIRRRAIRHYLGRIFATAASMVLSMPVYDTQCGAKLFRTSPELVEVLSQPFVSRWVFDVEMIRRLSQIRTRDSGRAAVTSIFEYPLQSWADIAGSKVKSGDFLKASLDLVRIWRDPFVVSLATAAPGAKRQDERTL